MSSDNNALQFQNSLSRKKEEFVAISTIFRGYPDNKVGVYTCGPTIYDFPTIGNYRTYVLSDVVVRTLKFLGYDVNYVMNLTDVGHLSGDNLGDASQGEDRMAKASAKEGLDAWAIADKYGQDFVDSFDRLNMIKPNVIAKVTDHITEQIKLIQQIEEKGFTYKTSDGIYFDVGKYESAGNTYGELSNIDEIRIEGQRIAENVEKKDPRDFALWKFFATGQKRHDMEWDSPWGEGYPGWHIECSAISMKYLGEQFDIHIGGEDLRSTHHPNEIAQSEAATGCKPFVKYWIHGAFLTVDGGRMGKSLGNAYTLHDIEAKGIDLIALRYFYFTGHYRKQINFTWEALEGAQTALRRLRRLIGVTPKYGSFDGQNSKYLEFFNKAISDDFNMPEALAITWEMAQDDTLDQNQKAALAMKFDEVLGFGLGKVQETEPKSAIPDEIKELAKERQQLRTEKKFDEADKVREQIEKAGYTIEDSGDDYEIS